MKRFEVIAESRSLDGALQEGANDDDGWIDGKGHLRAGRVLCFADDISEEEARAACEAAANALVDRLLEMTWRELHGDEDDR